MWFPFIDWVLMMHFCFLPVEGTVGIHRAHGILWVRPPQRSQCLSKAVPFCLTLWHSINNLQGSISGYLLFQMLPLHLWGQQKTQNCFSSFLLPKFIFACIKTAIMLDAFTSLQALVWNSSAERKKNMSKNMWFLWTHPCCYTPNVWKSLWRVFITLNEHCNPADCDANENRYIREKEWFEILQVFPSNQFPHPGSIIFSNEKWAVLLVAAADSFCGVKCNISFLLRNYRVFIFLTSIHPTATVLFVV